jgi:hypothetical protein
MQQFSSHNTELVSRCVTNVKGEDGKKKVLFTMMNFEQMKRVLSTVFDKKEFLSDFGLRSISKYHKDHPLAFENRSVCYEPGESLEKIKGGNSNWRGPIWFPTNYLFLNSLEKLKDCLGDNYLIPMKDGSSVSLEQLDSILKESLVSLFRKDGKGKRPVHGDYLQYREDPYFKDLILFYEHYHGDTGRGLGASHQTGWSGLVANVIKKLK